MNKLIELWHHLRRPHYTDFANARTALCLASMYRHQGRIETCICGEYRLIDRRHKTL